MALDRKQAPFEEQEPEEEEEEEREVQLDGPAHHPPAPPDELFDISTTVDPSYIISLIRKLLPTDSRSNHNAHGVDACLARSQVANTNHVEDSSASLFTEEVLNSSNDKSESMDIVEDYDKHVQQEGENGNSSHRSDRPSISGGEEDWEEYGCILWDLAASKTNAELMAQNLIVEVLLANLLVTESVRVKEISLGIIGNLACHEVPLKCIVSTNGLVEIIVDQLFLDDAQCLSEVCRLLTLGLQSCESIVWAEALRSEHILCRILWVTENTLNLQLIEKSVGLLLAIVESKPEVVHVLVPPLMKQGLPSILINLFTLEMSKLTSERVPERYSILDVVLRAIEALSAIDGHSEEICSNKQLVRLACDLVKLQDKVEVANSCVTAAVLIANILSDMSNLASEISQDLPFLQGLLEIFPFASDDLEARSALWSIIARLLFHVRENEMSQPSLSQYVSVLVSKSDLIEDDLLDYQVDDSSKGPKGLTASCTKSNARTTAVSFCVLVLARK
ncbi:Protein saal1 [Morella rubra]|uniref:Protein saal1 n=1 Tax=Morella rubra TaxID=262757 RepID=A0A6A1WQA9_9ROSI|nr:Protein saal1 [Morella rubra]